MWSDHKRIEERSLMLHREIARRVRENPDLVDRARRNLTRWIRSHGIIPPWKRWRAILRGPLPEILAALESRSESARELRQSSLFCGILSPAERWHVYESYTIGAYYKGRRQHRRR